MNQIQSPVIPTQTVAQLPIDPNHPNNGVKVQPESTQANPVEQKPVTQQPKPPSAIAMGIANSMGGLTVKAGVLGAAIGAVYSSYQDYSPLGVAVAAVASGTISAGGVALFTNGIIVAADATVDMTIYAVKLPVRAAGHAATATIATAQSVYQRIMGASKPETQAA